MFNATTTPCGTLSIGCTKLMVLRLYVCVSKAHCCTLLISEAPCCALGMTNIIVTHILLPTLGELPPLESFLNISNSIKKRYHNCFDKHNKFFVIKKNKNLNTYSWTSKLLGAFPSREKSQPNKILHLNSSWVDPPTWCLVCAYPCATTLMSQLSHYLTLLALTSCLADRHPYLPSYFEYGMSTCMS